MNIRIEQEEAACVMIMAGRLDGTTAQIVESAFLQELDSGSARFVFDLKELDYISSAGLRVMLLAAKKTRASGGKLALCGLNDSVREVFEISGFHTIFALYGEREEALKLVTA